MAAFRQGFAAAVAVVVALAVPCVADAYTTASGYSAQDYVTGFPESAANHWGPIGIAFDQSDDLYVADTVDGNIYRFPPGGGVASAASRLTSSPIPGTIEALVFSRSGDLYLARYHPGDVLQVDPATGRVTRTIAQVPCATGVAVDPVSGDLFVSENQCGSTVWRVSGFASGAGTVTPYASLPGVDGLAFDQDGTLYAESDGNVVEITGTASPAPGLATSVARVPEADGLAFGDHASGQPPYLVANRNDGTVTRVDFGPSGPAESTIFSRGTRGDFAAVDSHGCLYITQSSSIVRISSDGGSCAFEPSTLRPAPAGGLAIANLSPSPNTAAHVCTRIRSLSFRLRPRGGARLRKAVVYVNGRSVKRLTGASLTRPITLNHLPSSSFTVRVVATTTRGRRLITRSSFANCARPPGPRCTGTRLLVMRVPQRRGHPVVRVAEYVNGRRRATVHGRRVTRVSLRALPRGPFTVRLVASYAGGGRTTRRSRFVGCQ